MYTSGPATIELSDGAAKFAVTVLEPAETLRTVIFAVGAGGNPERHLPLLTSLAEQGCTVVAPHFERLVAPTPTDNELLLRARRLRLALDFAARPELQVAGVGHSIGATMLLALVGGQVWMRTGNQLPIVPDARIERLVLLTPATDFFQPPGALDEVHTPIFAWAGTKDVITPPVQTEFLKRALRSPASVEVRVAEGAGHFSFMNEPPPHMIDPLPNRAAFLTRLADEVCQFVLS